MLGQMRPNNRTTLINDDLVGTTHESTSWPLVRAGIRERYDGSSARSRRARRRVVPVWCVPVRFTGASSR